MTKTADHRDPRDRLGEIDKMSDAEQSYVSMQARQDAEDLWSRKGGDTRPHYLKIIGQYLAAKADAKIREGK